ncbi:MAG: DNA methyltransferase [Pseudomonadota bacterium]
MQQLNVELRPIADLVPYDRNARTHSKEQIAQIARSIERFGFTNPVLVDDEGGIITGHGRVAAAKQLEWTEVPTLPLSHLSEDEKRAYILADNKLAENAGWNEELLAIELQGLIDLDFDLDLIGFSTTEVDIVLDGPMEKGPTAADDRLDAVPDLVDGWPVTQRGDLWHLGRHRLLCGDAKTAEDVQRLCHGMGTFDTKAGSFQSAKPIDMLFTDPPYNVKIDGHVSGLGKDRHREFTEASGEMTKAGFAQFLTETLGQAASVLRDGAIAYVCMDWRHMSELLTAGEAVFNELKNLCIWNKTNRGMGTLYRSKHELVFVFKKGTAPHINNFGLGDGGRYRTNVWDYAGISSLSSDRAEKQAMHPTVKPVAMIADAMRDCSHRGDTILDIFGGSGSTLIAAEECGRTARLLELDPRYCDTVIRRWHKLTGQNAILKSAINNDQLDEFGPQQQKRLTHIADTAPSASGREHSGQTFDQVRALRLAGLGKGSEPPNSMSQETDERRSMPKFTNLTDRKDYGTARFTETGGAN